METFFRRQLITARKAVESLTRRLLMFDYETFEDKVELRDELTLTTTSPSKLLIEGISDDCDDRLKFERLREAFLMVPAATVDAERIKYDMNGKIEEIHDYLNNNWYKGKKGSTNPKEFYAVYDDITNEVLRVHTARPLQIEPNTHLIKHSVEMRQTNDGRHVMSHIRLKEPEMAVLKSVRETILRNGNSNGNDVVTPQIDNKDFMGIMLIVENPEDRTAVMEQVIQQIKDKEKDNFDKHIPKPVTGDKYQSSFIDYDRQQIWLKDSPFAFEA